MYIRCLCRAQIAGAMTRQRYGFVFGCNMFLALLIETILTAVVVDENGLGVDVVTQVRTDLVCFCNTLLSRGTARTLVLSLSVGFGC